MMEKGLVLHSINSSIYFCILTATDSSHLSVNAMNSIVKLLRYIDTDCAGFIEFLEIKIEFSSPFHVRNVLSDGANVIMVEVPASSR